MGIALPNGPKRLTPERVISSTRIYDDDQQMITTWHESQTQIDSCRRCDQDAVPYLVVPDGLKRHPPYPPPEPTQLLFVSVAPPQGGDYFWDESKGDKVREGLFSALAKATGQRFKTVREF